MTSKPSSVLTYPVLSVLRILDAESVIVSGTNLQEIDKEEKLIILAQGPLIEEIGVPLLTIKATMKVAEHAGEYLILKPTGRWVEEERVVGGSITSYLREARSKTVRVYRPDSLEVDEKAKIGDPSARPISLGDVVIRHSDFANYVSDAKALLRNSKKG